MKTNLFLIILLLSSIFACDNAYSQRFQLDCLSSADNKLINELYPVFEKKLIEKYGKQEIHKLMYQYVNDFHLHCISLYCNSEADTFFKTFQINILLTEFNRLFYRVCKMPLMVDCFYLVGYSSCFFQQKSENENLNEVFETLVAVGDIGIFTIADWLSSYFSQDDYKDPILQTFVLLQLFIFPNLKTF